MLLKRLLTISTILNGPNKISRKRKLDMYFRRIFYVHFLSLAGVRRGLFELRMAHVPVVPTSADTGLGIEAARTLILDAAMPPPPEAGL